MTLTLYDMRDSPHARKVLAAELGIPLEKIECDPRKGETRSPDNLAKNPNDRVPVLEEDGISLWESPAILKYLAAKRPERAWAAAIPSRRRWSTNGCFGGPEAPEAAIDAIDLHQAEILKQPGNDPGIIADAHARISRFLPVLDSQLQVRDYIVGPLSIADFAIGPRLDRAPELLKIDIAPYRNIAAWRERLSAKPDWATA
jgi:glutathione S-transferase